jgi:hypothetical protein
VDEQLGQIDRMLSKYVSARIWSIILGASTGVSLTYANYRVFGDWRQLGLLLAPLLIVGGLAALLTWYSLFRYLTAFLIPMFARPYPPDPGQQEQITLEGARLLRQTVGYLIVSLAVAFIIAIVQVLLSALRFF